MTEQTLLHQTEVDGVRCVWVDTGRPTLAAQLMFRQGASDEPLEESGWLHLIEHLTLHGRGGGALQVNGSVAMLLTSFDVHGPADLVAGHLADVTAGLGRIDGAELAREQRVLRAESELRTGAVHRAFGWRYGARGPGVVSYAEPGLSRATVESLTERSGRVFTRGNAVLALDGPPPAGLALHLPDGERMEPAAAVPCETQFPAAYRDAPQTALLSGVVTRSSAATLLPDLVQGALRRELRDSAGGAYAPWAVYEAVDADRAVVLAGSDLLVDMQRGIAGRLTETLARLRREGPGPEELQQLVEVRLQALDDPFSRFGLALRAAHSIINGRDPESFEQVRGELVGITAGDLATDLDALAATALYALPPAAEQTVLRELEFGLEPPSAEGRVYRNINWPTDAAELVVGRERVELRSPAGARSAELADVAGLMVFPDGARHLVRSDGYGLTVDPRWWKNGREAVAEIDRQVSADKHLHRPERELEPVPQASTWTRVRAHYRRFTANPVVMVVVLLAVVAMIGVFVATGRWFGVLIWGWFGYAVARDLVRRRE